MCYICHMPDSPEKNTALNVRVVPEELIRKAKSSAALQGKTLREWIIEAIREKLRKAK
jgi:predicted HicB family RNase H-like nuclease